MSNLKFNKTQRLSKDTYKRPFQTTTDKLTTSEIRDLLRGYAGVDDIRNVELGTHLRYFIIDGKQKKFRFGGILTKNIMPKQNKYIVLSNGEKSWSVQVKDRVFFRKLTRKELMDEADNKIKKLTIENDYLKDKIRKLRHRLRGYGQYQKEQ